MTAQDTAPRISLTKGSAFMTGSRVIAVGVGYLLNVYLARKLGPASFGLFAVIITVLVWLELVVAEGLPLWVVRTVEPGEDKPLIPRRYLLAQLGVSFVLALALAAAAPALARVFGQAPGDAMLFRVSAIDVPIFGLYNLLLAVLLGSRVFGRQAIATAGYSITKFIATVALVAAGLSVLGAVVGSIVGSVGGLVVALLLILLAFRGRRLFGGVETARAEPGCDMEVPGGALPTGAVIGSAVPAVLLIAQTLVLSADLWLVKALLPAVAAGYYRAASLVAQVPIALSAGLVWGLYSAYSAAHRRGDTDRLGHYVSQAARLLIAAGVLWIALVAPTSKSLLATIFSARYVAGAQILTVLATGTAIGLIGVAFAPILLIEGHGRAVLAVSLGLVAAEVVLVFALIPRLGATGAAIAVALVFATATVVVFAAVRARLRFPIAGTLARLIGPAVIVGLAAAVVRPAPGISLVAWYALFAAVYVGLLFAVRGLTADDVSAIREGLR